ncbi:MAG: hypothetical protein GWN45_01570 [Gammaproteobacteria bacterium]|nr:hypothetical protein [Gammaproteobacteria bacterium]NIQ74054.1 hypothetical protein [Gammaproteobacteria bacterium]NIV26079.1 hypothetical protein [Gammaproteobacteria bacterium]NIW10734.1 hypothetical protein [Gammaproteobacteria bacterium]
MAVPVLGKQDKQSLQDRNRVVVILILSGCYTGVLVHGALHTPISTPTSTSLAGATCVNLTQNTRYDVAAQEDAHGKHA